MNTKRILAALLLAAVLLSLFAACGKKQDALTLMAEAASSEPASAEPLPVTEPAAEPVPTESVVQEPSVTAHSQEMALLEPVVEPTPEPVPEPTAEPTPVPTAKPVPQPVYDIPAPEEEQGVRPGTYTGSDGSILIVEEDGACTYETEVSGKINGKAMSAALVFHGVVGEDGVFSFDKVMYGALDLTALAAAAGYTDASPWEAAAAIIYGG